jgi:hypothetical protein
MWIVSGRHVFARDDSLEGRQAHRYWSVVESRRVAGRRVVQRPHGNRVKKYVTNR